MHKKIGTWYGVRPANTKMINFLLKRKAKGDKIILWTYRTDEALGDAIVGGKEI